jgi:hypothetical protein
LYSEIQSWAHFAADPLEDNTTQVNNHGNEHNEPSKTLVISSSIIEMVWGLVIQDYTDFSEGFEDALKIDVSQKSNFTL